MKTKQQPPKRADYSALHQGTRYDRMGRTNLQVFAWAREREGAQVIDGNGFVRWYTDGGRLRKLL